MNNRLRPDEIWDRYKYEERYEPPYKTNRDPYLGFHQIPCAERGDWSTFEVYSRGGNYYWTYVNECGEPRECEEGPFSSAKEAYHDAC